MTASAPHQRRPRPGRAAWSRVTPARATAVSAIVSLAAIAGLGAVLSAQLNADAIRRGRAQAVAQARHLAAVDLEPLLPRSGPVHALTPEVQDRLADIDRTANAAHVEAELRVRATDGSVIFAGAGKPLPPHADGLGDDEVLEAAAGEPVSAVTRLNTDPGDVGPPGPEVAEVYLPLLRPGDRTAAVVIELYIPWQPIKATLAAESHRLHTTLALGLGALWLVLAGIGTTFTAGLRRIARRNAWLAGHDTLTGLRNRRGFTDRIALTGRSEPAWVLALDLDHFSEVNDTLGQEAGDTLLRTTARRLRACAPAGSVVARLHGDVFGVLMTPRADAGAVAGPGWWADVLRRAVEGEIVVAGVSVSPSATVGFSWSEGGAAPVAPVDLLRRAELALGTAKERGEAVLAFTAGIDAFDPDRLQLAADLRRAIDEQAIVVHYQPKADTVTGRVTSAEALARWTHPVRGAVSPADFVQLAERTSMIASLTDLIVGRVVDDIATAAVPPGWRISVNISARNLGDAGFPDRLVAILAAADVPPERLCLEITETALMADPARAEAALDRLTRTGFAVSLDDFGQGYTSLSQLGKLPLTEVKIDRAFVAGAAHATADAAVVQAVVDIGHALGLSVVAEGVEDADTLRLLRGWGCDAFQGWLLGAAVPVDELAPWAAVPAVPQQRPALPATTPAG